MHETAHAVVSGRTDRWAIHSLSKSKKAEKLWSIGPGDRLFRSSSFNCSPTLMRHDAKLGLALGMMVIGFAVAFCFPRTSPLAPQKLEPVPAPISDATLELLPIRTYQSGFADRGANRGTPSADDQKAVPPITPLTPILLDGLPVTAPRLAPVSAVAASKSVSPGLLIAASEPQEKVPSRSFNVEAAKDQQETYLVKPGDTLTGIATRLLGNSSRYGELFAANQDVLSSPNDLKIGMRLRVPPLIPVKEEPSPESRPATTVRNEPSSSLPSLPRGSLPPRFQRPPTAPWIAEEPREQRSRQ